MFNTVSSMNSMVNGDMCVYLLVLFMCVYAHVCVSFLINSTRGLGKTC